MSVSDDNSSIVFDIYRYGELNPDREIENLVS